MVLLFDLFICCRRFRLHGRPANKANNASADPTLPIAPAMGPRLQDDRSAREWLIPHPLQYFLTLPPETAELELKLRLERLMSGASELQAETTETDIAPRIMLSLAPPSFFNLDDHVLQRIMAFCCGPSLCRLRATTRVWQQIDSDAHYANLLLVDFGLRLSHMCFPRGRPIPSCRTVYLALCSSRGAVFSDTGVSAGLASVIKTGLRIPSL